MDELNLIKKRIINSFKLCGFFIKSDTSIFLAKQLLPLERKERDNWLDKLTAHVQNQNLQTTNVELENIELAIKECCNVGGNSSNDDTETIFNIINAYDVPKYTFDNNLKQYVRNSKKCSFLPSSSSKSDYIRERYSFLYHRTSRHELFSPQIPGTTSDVKKFQLINIENLLSNSKLNEIVVLGLLTQLKEGKFFLEDPTGIIEIDLKKTRYHSGLYCDGCFVLAEGVYRDSVLKVSGLGFPPPEPAISSRSFFGTQNTWGGKSKTLLKLSKYLYNYEQMNNDKIIVFLSDCCLDNQLVLDKLKMLFEGYDECPPIAIVMMGSFSLNCDNPINLKSKFKLLSEIVDKYSRIKKETNLVLIPSTDDPCCGNILPRPALPEFIVSDLRKVMPKLYLGTNPCRIQYCTQQILVCRADLVTKLCRNTLHFPTEGEIQDHFARTLICQANLSPLHPIILPTYWDYDAALTLYPLPDLIVIGDPSHSFNTTQQNCIIMNTGSFQKSNFAFKVYVPATRTIEDSEIPD